MYTLVLAEAALEKIPKALWKHPAVARYSERRGKPAKDLLLDVSYHFSAMHGLLEREKRGRPDIVHFTLLEALGSPLARQGLLQVYVHSRVGVSIRIAIGTRLPRNYERFSGLFEQVLKAGRAPFTGEPLLTAKEESLGNLLAGLHGIRRFMLRENAAHLSLKQLGKVMYDSEDAVILVGGFPHGDFSPVTRSLADLEASIYGEPLEAWTVVSRMLGVLEDLHGLYA